MKNSSGAASLYIALWRTVRWPSRPEWPKRCSNWVPWTYTGSNVTSLIAFGDIINAAGSKIVILTNFLLRNVLCWRSFHFGRMLSWRSCLRGSMSSRRSSFRLFWRNFRRINPRLLWMNLRRSDLPTLFNVTENLSLRKIRLANSGILLSKTVRFIQHVFKTSQNAAKSPAWNSAGRSRTIVTIRWSSHDGEKVFQAWKSARNLSKEDHYGIRRNVRQRDPL